MIWLLKGVLYLVCWRIDAYENMIHDSSVPTRIAPRLLALRNVWRNLADTINDVITEEEATQ